MEKESVDTESFVILLIVVLLIRAGNQLLDL